MKPFISFFLICLMTVGLSFRKGKASSGSFKLPVYILYKNEIPPDSIQDFLKIYFQLKKIKIVSQEELTALVGQEMNATVQDLINRGTLNERTAKNIADKFDQVGNILAVHIFDNDEEKAYLIDSIGWQTKFVPAKDTAFGKKINFVPDSITKSDIYNTLKAFVDQVISSGYLR